MSVGFKFEGGKDLERALGELKRGTAKGVSRRVLKKVLKPVAEAAEASPFTIAVTSALTARQRRGAWQDFRPSVVAMYVGPVDDDGQGEPHAHLLEFGTMPRYHRKSGKYVGAVMADPFMRPAWDANSGDMLERLGVELWQEIEKSVKRAAAKAANAGA